MHSSFQRTGSSVLFQVNSVGKRNDAFVVPISMSLWPAPSTNQLVAARQNVISNSVRLTVCISFVTFRIVSIKENLNSVESI